MNAKIRATTGERAILHSSADLLAIASQKILGLEQPACIKDSSLHYVAVNDAYAALFGAPTGDFAGAMSADLLDDDFADIREESESRCAVFGRDGTVDFKTPTGDSYEISIEQFVTEEGGVYLFELLTPSSVAGASTTRARASSASSGENSQPYVVANENEKLALFKAVLDSVPVATFVRDLEHRLIYANDAYCALSDRPIEALLGSTEADIFGEVGERMRRDNHALLHTGEIARKESRFPLADGTMTPCMVRVGWIKINDGTPYLVGAVTDISDLKQRERELDEAHRVAETSRKSLREIIDSVQFGIFVMRQSDHEVEVVNQAAIDFWDAEALLPLEGKTYGQLLDFNFQAGRYNMNDDEYRAYKARILDMMDSGEFEPREVATENGRIFLVRGTRIGSGRVILTYDDVSEIRAKEREINEARVKLAETGSLLKESLASIDNGLLILDRNAQILACNETLKRILGIPDDFAVTGLDFETAFRERFPEGEDDSAASNEILECVLADEPREVVVRFKGDVWLRVGTTQTEGGYGVAVFTDVSEDKRREAQLELLVARAEAADRAKSEFLANMNHEIRTPMNGVLGMAELLAKSEMEPKQKTFVDVIVKSGNALLTIINDILDFSKIDAGQMQLRSGTFDPVEAAEDVATLLNAGADEKDVELVVRHDRNVPQMVHGDAGRFRQILTNLVGNAVKFTDKGHVLIDMSADGDDEEATLHISVKDTGMGIPEEKLASVFEKFSQVDGSSTRRHEGTGLGLAITSGLVDLFGGKIDVTSEIGKGTTFTVHLPMKVASSSVQKFDFPINFAGARILVVDDNKVNRDILTEQMDGWGLDACAAEDAAQGLAVLEAAESMHVPVDVIVLDYHMPGMNGIELAKLIRSKPQFDDTPIIFLTSMDMNSAELSFAEEHVQAHLMKPARSQLLKTTLKDVLRDRQHGKVLSKAGRDGRDMLSGASAHGSNAELTPIELVSSHQAVSPSKGDTAAPAPASPDLDLLIAEDNEVNQIVFTQILEAAGYRFKIVDNGEAAVEAWRALRPPLILMDVSMPRMNGHEATRTIRSIEVRENMARTPIVGVTAHALESDRDLCLAAGMDDYLSKPISPERLEEKIRKWSPAVSEKATG